MKPSSVSKHFIWFRSSEFHTKTSNKIILALKTPNLVSLLLMKTQMCINIVFYFQLMHQFHDCNIVHSISYVINSFKRFLLFLILMYLICNYYAIQAVYKLVLFHTSMKTSCSFNCYAIKVLGDSKPINIIWKSSIS